MTYFLFARRSVFIFCRWRECAAARRSAELRRPADMPPHGKPDSAVALASTSRVALKAAAADAISGRHSGNVDGSTVGAVKPLPMRLAAMARCRYQSCYFSMPPQYYSAGARCRLRRGGAIKFLFARHA